MQDNEENRAAWQRHYGRQRARQNYPDENLVRMLKKIPTGPALDLGCGSGRHLLLLNDLGFGPLSGTDVAQSSLDLCRDVCQDHAVRADLFLSAPDSAGLPLPAESQAVVVCWGVLHYNSEAAIQALLAEIARVLRADGVLLGTLRAQGDTHFQKNPDMAGASLRLYSEAEVRATLAPFFRQADLGYAERTPVGELESRICHYLFSARKAG